MNTINIKQLIDKIHQQVAIKAKEGMWIQDVNKSMKKNNTKGAFTEWCGGKVTNDCIERGLRSKDPKIRRRAALAKAFRNMKKEEGGITDDKTLSYIDSIKNDYLSKINVNLRNHMLSSMADKVADLEDAYGNYYSSIDQINQLSKELYGGLIEYADGGDIDMQDVGNDIQQQLQQQQQQQQQQQTNAPQITYEEYVKFITQYPDYLQRFLSELNSMMQQGQQQGQPQEAQQQAPQEQMSMSQGQ